MVIVVVFELDVDVVDVVNFFEIYFLLNSFVIRGWFYIFCFYICCYVFINCVISVDICVYVVVGLGGGFV